MPSQAELRSADRRAEGGWVSFLDAYVEQAGVTRGERPTWFSKGSILPLHPLLRCLAELLAIIGARVDRSTDRIVSVTSGGLTVTAAAAGCLQWTLSDHCSPQKHSCHTSLQGRSHLWWPWAFLLLPLFLLAYSGWSQGKGMCMCWLCLDDSDNLTVSRFIIIHHKSG